MGLFGPKLPVERDEFNWLFACFAWLHRELGRIRAETADNRPLVVPDRPELREAQTASELFEAVKRIAGLSDWPCELEQGEVRQDDYRTGLAGSYSSRHALGTFSVEGNRTVIRYNPTQLRDPDALTATFAHELAHMLLHSLGDPPGGHELNEHATDCAAVYLGFGVFLANSARRFEQFQGLGMHGWRAHASGYLSEGALVTLLALFVRLFAHEPGLAATPLKSYLKRDFSSALGYVDRHFPDVPDALAAVDFSDWN